MRKRGLVFGVGINDAGYVVKVNEVLSYFNGKKKEKLVWFCPYYRKWCDMIARCYSNAYLKRNPTYVGCSVDGQWLLFSNFKRWVDSQPNKNWETCHLDKDLLCVGNKIYGPETCVFVSPQLNKFSLDRKLRRGKYLLGVGIHKKTKLFTAACSDPFTNQHAGLGYFRCELEAHKAWQAKKHQYACQLADLQEDPRVAQALRERYAPDKDWTKA